MTEDPGVITELDNALDDINDIDLKVNLVVTILKVAQESSDSVMHSTAINEAMSQLTSLTQSK